MKISIIIPNYNGKELLKKNLPKILACLQAQEVIIVDDASTDGSVEEIKFQISNLKKIGQKREIRIIQNERNLGFASTASRGVREAIGELVVLLNTDVCPESDFLEAAISYFDDQKVFAVGFLQKCQENGYIVLRGRGIGHFERGFLIHEKGEVDKKNTLWVSGGAGMFRKTIWEELGGMEKLYNPFYWEDIDLSYRALKAGYILIFEPKSIVIHQQHEGVIKSTYSPFFIKTLAYRNQILFVWLNITDTPLIIQHLIFLPIHFIRSLVTGDWAFISGLFLAIQLIPLVFFKRRKNKILSHINDAQVLKNFSG